MKYDSILNAPHWEPRSRSRMSAEKRAAQFQPFDPLEGYEETVIETARETDSERAPDETGIDSINRLLLLLQTRLRETPEVCVTYFVPDQSKAGGAYRTVTGSVKKIDETERLMILTDGTSIPFSRIFSLRTPDSYT